MYIYIYMHVYIIVIYCGLTLPPRADAPLRPKRAGRTKSSSRPAQVFIFGWLRHRNT